MTIKDFITPAQYRYYYTQLNNDDKRVYDALLDGMLAHRDTLRITHCSVGQIQRLHPLICLDVPELFFVKHIEIRCCLSTCTITPIYRFTADETTEMLYEIEHRYSVFIKNTQALSPIERVKAIHDLFAQNVVYKDLDKPYSHEAPGTLLYGIGVCEGMSKAFKYLADRVGIKSIVAAGISNAHGNSDGHAWNIVELNGNHYHLDITFDATIGDGKATRYDYFCLSDEEIRTNHSWQSALPTCDKGLDYYVKAGAFCESRSKLAALVRKLSRGNKPFVFQVPIAAKSEQDTMVKAVFNTIENNLSGGLFSNRSYYISYNPDRMVFQVQYQND